MKNYRQFNEARDYVHALGLKKEKLDWRDYCKSGLKPQDIPSYPNKVYIKNGWVGIYSKQSSQVLAVSQ